MKILSKSKLIKSTFIYTIINFVNKVFPFILLPIFTRQLSLEEYGSYALIKAATSVLIPIVGFSVSEAVIRVFFEYSKKRFSTYVTTALAVATTICILLIIGIVSLPADFFPQYFDLSNTYIAVALFISYFTVINNIERGLLRCEGNNKVFAILVLMQSFSFFIAILLIYFLGRLSLVNILITELASFSSFGLISLLLLYKKYNINFQPNRSSARHIIRYSLPLVLNSLLAYAFAISDRFIISNKLDNAAVALYSATFQVVSILQILAVSFNSAWVPYVYKTLGDETFNLIEFKRKRVYLLGAFLVLGVLFFIVLKYGLVLVLGEKYRNGDLLLIWMVLSNSFQAYYWIVSPVVQFYNKNWLLTTASLPAFLFSIIMNLVFLSDKGIVFAAQINALSWFIIFLFTFYNSNRLLNQAPK